MSILNHIEGHITLTAPLICAAPSEGKGGTTTKTMMQPIVGPNGKSFVPFFPASDLRGRLRRKAASILIDHLTTNHGKISIDLLSGLTCGSVTANGENDVSVEEVLRARDNVYMGVFGGGIRLLRSGIKVHDVMPFLEETLTAGIVPSYLGVEAPMTVNENSKNNEPTPLRGWQLIHRHHSVKVDDVYRVLNMDLINKSLADPLNEVAAHQAHVLESQKERKEDKERSAADKEGVKKVTLSNMMIAEAISIGTQMHFRVDIEDHLNDAQKGLVLMAVRDLCNEQALGGMVRHGWGKFKAELRGVFDGENVDDNGQPNPVIAFNQNTGLYEVVGVAAAYVEKAKEEIAKITIEDMALFFKANSTKAKEKTSKTKASKAAAPAEVPEAVEA